MGLLDDMLEEKNPQKQMTLSSTPTPKSKSLLDDMLEEKYSSTVASPIPPQGISPLQPMTINKDEQYQRLLNEMPPAMEQPESPPMDIRDLRVPQSLVSKDKGTFQQMQHAFYDMWENDQPKRIANIRELVGENWRGQHLDKDGNVIMNIYNPKTEETKKFFIDAPNIGNEEWTTNLANIAAEMPDMIFEAEKFYAGSKGLGALASKLGLGAMTGIVGESTKAGLTEVISETGKALTTDDTTSLGELAQKGGLEFGFSLAGDALVKGIAGATRLPFLSAISNPIKKLVSKGKQRIAFGKGVGDTYGAGTHGSNKVSVREAFVNIPKEQQDIVLKNVDEILKDNSARRIFGLTSEQEVDMLMSAVGTSSKGDTILQKGKDWLTGNTREDKIKQFLSRFGDDAQVKIMDLLVESGRNKNSKVLRQLKNLAGASKENMKEYSSRMSEFFAGEVYPNMAVDFTKTNATNLNHDTITKELTDDATRQIVDSIEFLRENHPDSFQNLISTNGIETPDVILKNLEKIKNSINGKERVQLETQTRAMLEDFDRQLRDEVVTLFNLLNPNKKVDSKTLGKEALMMATELSAMRNSPTNTVPRATQELLDAYDMSKMFSENLDTLMRYTGGKQNILASSDVFLLDPAKRIHNVIFDTMQLDKDNPVYDQMLDEMSDETAQMIVDARLYETLFNTTGDVGKKLQDMWQVVKRIDPENKAYANAMKFYRLDKATGAVTKATKDVTQLGALVDTLANIKTGGWWTKLTGGIVKGFEDFKSPYLQRESLFRLFTEGAFDSTITGKELLGLKRLNTITNAEDFFKEFMKQNARKATSLERMKEDSDQPIIEKYVEPTKGQLTAKEQILKRREGLLSLPFKIQ